jgi:invasion protein IalB
MRFGFSAGLWVSCFAASAMMALPGPLLAQESTPPAAQQPAAAQPSPTPEPAKPAPSTPAAQPAPGPAPAQPTPPPTTSDLSTAPPPTSPAAPSATKTVYGAWTDVCGSPDGSAEKRCVLIQSVVSQERPEMQISVAISKTPGSKNALLRVQAPLSVLLPNGLGLYVDGNDIGNAYFARCFSDGCYAEVVLEDQLLTQLRKGATATFTVFQTQEEGIGIPVDLKGFAEGYDALP